MINTKAKLTQGGSELPVRCRGSCGGAWTPESTGRSADAGGGAWTPESMGRSVDASEGVRTSESTGRSVDAGGGARRPPAVGGVDAREGVRTPESLGTVAARCGREHGRRRTWATGGRGAGPRHLKVENPSVVGRGL